MSSNSRTINNILELFKLKVQDTGEYECFTYYGERAQILLTVRNPEAIHYHIRSSIYASSLIALKDKIQRQVCYGTTNNNDMDILWINNKKEVRDFLTKILIKQKLI